MNARVPGILVTGASGFIGKHFVTDVYKNFRLFCLARQSQKEVGISFHNHIHWLQGDITNWKYLLSTLNYVQDHGGVDYVLHLAGYYDFTMKDNLAYERTNVSGTRAVLEISKLLELKRFIFTSSLAACEFPPQGSALTEDSPADADYPYAHSKRKGEALVAQYFEKFPCSVVRLAAVYSDWCEYPMLYMLLNLWLSKNRIISKVVAGKGESAIPYIHIKDLIKLFLQIFEISDRLPRFAIYNASPQGCVSQNELYQTAVKYYHGRDIEPVRLPKPVASLGLVAKYLLSRLNDKEPLEQPWMRKYIDKQLRVDASATYNALGWKPTPRYHILRRLLFLTEKKMSRPNDWDYRNQALLKRVAFRKSTAIYMILSELEGELIAKTIEEVMRPENVQRFPNYRKMDQELLRWYVSMHYHLITSSVRTRDRAVISNYMKVIGHERYLEGFKAGEVKDLIFLTAKIMKESLLDRQELKGAKQRLDDYIILTAQFAADELEDNYEIFESQASRDELSIQKAASLVNIENIRQIIAGLDDIGPKASSDRLSGEITFKNYGVLLTLTGSEE